MKEIVLKADERMEVIKSPQAMETGKKKKKKRQDGNGVNKLLKVLRRGMLERPSSVMTSESLIIAPISERAPCSGQEERERKEGGNLYRHKSGAMKRLCYVSLMN